MIVRLFKPQFSPLVEAGTKKQTVRPAPKRMPIVGQAISLREWTGKPYRSPQRELRRSWVTKVEKIMITAEGILLGRFFHKKDEGAAFAFARADGFDSTAAFFEFFATTHVLPFAGIVIHWK